jgi:hypothetical protein
MTNSSNGEGIFKPLVEARPADKERNSTISDSDDGDCRSGCPLHEYSREILAVVDEQDDPQDRRENSRLPSHGRQQKEERDDIDNDRREHSQGERNIAVYQQQGAADQLDCAHEEDVVGLEHCAHELTCNARRHRLGEKVQVRIKAEGDKDDAQQDAGDDDHDFHECSLYCNSKIRP